MVHNFKFKYFVTVFWLILDSLPPHVIFGDFFVTYLSQGVSHCIQMALKGTDFAIKNTFDTFSEQLDINTF